MFCQSYSLRCPDSACVIGIRVISERLQLSSLAPAQRFSKIHKRISLRVIRYCLTAVSGKQISPYSVSVCIYNVILCENISVIIICHCIYGSSIFRLCKKLSQSVICILGYSVFGIRNFCNPFLRVIFIADSPSVSIYYLTHKRRCRAWLQLLVFRMFFGYLSAVVAELSWYESCSELKLVKHLASETVCLAAACNGFSSGFKPDKSVFFFRIFSTYCSYASVRRNIVCTDKLFILIFIYNWKIHSPRFYYISVKNEAFFCILGKIAHIICISILFQGFKVNSWNQLSIWVIYIFIRRCRNYWIVTWIPFFKSNLSQLIVCELHNITVCIYRGLNPSGTWFVCISDKLLCFAVNTYWLQIFERVIFHRVFHSVSARYPGRLV